MADRWTFLTNHAQVLLCIAADQGISCVVRRSAGYGACMLAGPDQCGAQGAGCITA